MVFIQLGFMEIIIITHLSSLQTVVTLPLCKILLGNFHFQKDRVDVFFSIPSTKYN